MDNTTRLQYLAAMDIDVWVPRVTAENAVIEDCVSEPVADSWEILQAQMQGCEQCTLCQSRQQVVTGAGNRQADLLLITEAPSKEDDQQGLPFADHSGELLTEMLRAMQLSRDDVFITHIVKCRPADDRDPKTEELMTCEPFLQRQIALLQPKVIIAVGRIAAHQLLKSKAPLAELRETEHEYLAIPLQTIFHPAYLLRSLSEKSKAWQDLRRILTLFEKIK